MHIFQKIRLYYDIYTLVPDAKRLKVSNNSHSDIFVYFGVVGDLVIYYNFIEQYSEAFSKQIIIVTLKNAHPFLRYMDRKNDYIDFENSVFFDENPTKRVLNTSDRENIEKLRKLTTENAFATPYETDLFTFLILNLIPAKNKRGFISYGQSIFRKLLLKNLFPKIQFSILGISALGSRIQSHSEAFLSICGKCFNFRGYDIPITRPYYAVISPFASEKDREYPYEKFKQVSNELFEDYGIRSIYLGLSSKREEDTRAISFEYNIPMEQLFDRIRHCSIFIGNDSGLTHIALRYNKKTIVLFSRLEQYGLYFPYNGATMITNQTISEIEPEEIVQKAVS